MPTRKSFLAAVAAAPLLGATPQAAQSPVPKPPPSATPKGRQPSELGKAFAERMRAFDSQLTKKNVHDIALGIDDNLGIGRAVNRKGTELKNWDEPVTVFEVPE